MPVPLVELRLYVVHLLVEVAVTVVAAETLSPVPGLIELVLQEVVRWKLNEMPGRRGGNVDRVGSVPDEFVRRVTEAALLVDDPTIQLKALKSIPGIGPATGTVVLTFYDPEHYGIGDRYILHEFFGEEGQMGVTGYPDILAELRDRNPGDFDLRTVEKAYYQRYRGEHDVGDW